MNIDIAYNPGDVVYYVNTYRILKVVVASITIQIEKDKPSITYNVYQYGCENHPKRKDIPVNAANLVKDFEIARKSALTNWEQIKIDVTNQLTELTDDMFVLKEEPNESK